MGYWVTEEYIIRQNWGNEVRTRAKYVLDQGDLIRQAKAAEHREQAEKARKHKEDITYQLSQLEKVEKLLPFLDKFGEQDINLLAVLYFRRLDDLHILDSALAESRCNLMKKLYPTFHLPLPLPALNAFKATLPIKQPSQKEINDAYIRCKIIATWFTAKKQIPKAAVLAGSILSIGIMSHILGYGMGARTDELPKTQLISDANVPANALHINVRRISSPFVTYPEDGEALCEFTTETSADGRPAIEASDGTKIYIHNQDSASASLQYRNGAEIPGMRKTDEFEIPANGTLELTMQTSNFPPHFLGKNPRIQCMNESVWAQRNISASQVAIVLPR